MYFGKIFVPLQSKMKRTAFILSFLLCVFGAYAQVECLSYSPQIRTLRAIYASMVDDAGQVGISRPLLSLTDGEIDGSNPENSLHISFDEMSHDVHFYTYMVRHMNADWSRESDITSGEYLRGFTTQDITDYTHSLNNSREYTHYAFVFPNSDMIITRSGNYSLVIYEDGNPDNCVAEVRFRVVEPMVQIDSRVRSNTDIELSGRYQQVDVDVTTSGIDVKDPNELKVVVRQNNRSDNEVWLPRPAYIEPRRMRYINMRELIFEGGNEYHHWDAFSTYYAGTGIDRVYYELGDYHVLLLPDETANGRQYIHEYDSDGQFIVNAERTGDSDTEAEYMWVHWMLPAEKPWFDGAVYVGGEVFGNRMGLENRMEYDNNARCYWLTALVKQGGYDYQYWFVPKSGTSSSANRHQPATIQRVDGSYWQTENEYAVYVYWRPFGARYDRLVGASIQKSAL